MNPMQMKILFTHKLYFIVFDKKDIFEGMYFYFYDYW